MNTPDKQVENSLRGKNPIWKRFMSMAPRAAIFLFVLLILAIIGWLIFRIFVLITEGEHTDLYGMDYISLESMTITIFFAVFVIILVSLPSLMVVTYNAIRSKEILNKAEVDLRLCGVGQTGRESELKDRMQTFVQKTSFSAYIWPTFIGTILLLIFWGIVIAPNGFRGGLESLNQGDTFLLRGSVRTKLDISKTLLYILKRSSPVTWSFLGAYYYILQSMMRRWMRSDLTSGFLWRINLRLIIAFIVGLLLIMASLESGDNVLSSNQTMLWIVAFIAGITPDIVISWIINRVKAIANIEGNSTIREWVADIFQPSDLQQKIDGLNFWQADRLLEEGVESVRNLATEEIPDLLVNTRFDTPRLIDWVDQALLCSQVGKTLPMECFRAVGVKAASDLLDIWDSGEDRQKALVKSLLVPMQDVIEESTGIPNDIDWQNTVFCLVENIVDGLRVGVNIEYIREYWKNSTPMNRSKVLETIYEKRLVR